SRVDAGARRTAARLSWRSVPRLIPRNSRTVIGTSATKRFWGTYPIFVPSRHAIVPSWGTRPRSVRRRTVFPAPFGPRIASVVPRRTSNETSWRTVRPSSRTVRFETRRAFGPRDSVSVRVRWAWSAIVDIARGGPYLKHALRLIMSKYLARVP